MWSYPTPDNFSEWLGWHLNKAHTAALKDVKAIRGKAAAEGNSGGNMVRKIIDTVDLRFDQGIASALGEANRIFEQAHLDFDDVERITKEKIKDFVEKMQDILRMAYGKSPGVIKILNKEAEELDKKWDFYFRQFSVGHFVPPDPEVPPSMKNEINIESMHGGAIQQGTTASKQSVRGQISISGADLGSLRDFIAQTKAALPLLPEAARTELQPVIEALEAETAQGTPDGGKVSSLLQSARAICEGVISNVTAAGIVAVATKLLAV